MSFSPSTRSKYSFSIKMSMHFWKKRRDFNISNECFISSQNCRPLQSCYLDDGNTRFESWGELVQHFCQKLLVLQNFPHLHDSHDSCLHTRVQKNMKNQKNVWFELQWIVSLFLIPVWGASCLPQYSYVLSPALVSALSSLAHWYSLVTSYCTHRDRHGIDMPMTNAQQLNI